MTTTNAAMVKQIARTAGDFERRRTGHAPKSVTAVLSDNTLVITLHGALTQAEQALAQTPAGAAQVQEFHRQLFHNSSVPLREEIKKITGVEVREAAVAVEMSTGVVTHVFTTGTVVQVFLLAHSVSADGWDASEAGGEG